MTSSDAANAEPGSPGEPLREQHLARILGAGRREPACGRKQGPEPHLVRSHELGGQARGPCAHAVAPPAALVTPEALRVSVRSTRWTSLRRSPNERLSRAGRPTKIT